MMTNFRRKISRLCRIGAIMICTCSLCVACNRDADEFIPEGGGNIPGSGTNDEDNSQMVLLASKKGSLLSSYTWQDYNTIGLFLTEGMLDRPYLDDKDSYSNIKATMYAGLWQLEPGPVQLTDEKAIIYAYSPYVRGADPYAIPVETTTRKLYMYGTHLKPQISVSSTDNVASLEMANAMAIIDINVRKSDNFRSNAFLQQISIEGRNDSIRLPVKGTMDIMTGQISSTGFGHYSIDDLQQALPLAYADSVSYRLTAFPRDNDDGEINLSITVNGNKMSMPLSAEHDWQAGIRNIYNIIFDGTDTRIETVYIRPWKDIEIKEGELNDGDGKKDE